MTLPTNPVEQRKILLALPEEEQKRISQHADKAREEFAGVLRNIGYYGCSDIERLVILNSLIEAWSAEDWALFGKNIRYMIKMVGANLRVPRGKFGEGMADHQILKDWSVDRHRIDEVLPLEKESADADPDNRP